MSNFPSTLFAGRRYAVVGLGRNGLAAATALMAMGAETVAWDDQPAAREAAIAEGVTVVPPEFGQGRWDGLVLSPGIPHLLPRIHPLAAAARAAGVPILSDVELLFQAVRQSGGRARFAGVTGTNGKSTTTALLAHILADAGIPMAAGGNLGPAALALGMLPDAGATQAGVYVIEMSSYMLERLASLRFEVATMLNLSPDHIDRHGDMAGYAAAKRAIFDRQLASDTAVLGIDDQGGRDMAAWRGLLPGHVVTISGSRPADIWCESGLLRDSSGVLADMTTAAALPGAHNAQNAAAACAMALALGVPRAALAAALASFPGLPHRQQLVATIDGVRFVNDSKATNADATAWALGCYDRLIWIAGGQAKQGGIADLAPFFPRIAEALLIGADAKLLAATLAAYGVPHRIVGTLEAAMPAAFAAARAAGVGAVLLSPACASFDQFSGFEARGTRFAALARSLAEPSLSGGETH
jgi:UDP-N-acetylmuramoylalanine--D-glutamate ligase